MGIIERKEREKMELRQRILEAAKEIFIEEGFEKASIRAIADKIEYSPATIYLHFKDKDELFFAVHELGFDKLFEVTKHLEAIPDGFEQLYQRGKIYLQFAIENPELYDLMFIKDAPMEAIKKKNGDDQWVCGMQNFVHLQKNIMLCMEQGYLQVSDVNVTAMSIWAYVHGLASLYIRGRFQTFSLMNPSSDLPHLMEASLEQVLTLLKKSNE